MLTFILLIFNERAYKLYLNAVETTTAPSDHETANKFTGMGCLATITAPSDAAIVFFIYRIIALIVAKGAW